MNQVSVSTIAGKLFWLSLISYSAAFTGFYGLTQYTQARIAQEESSGVFAAFKASACNEQAVCNETTLTNTFDATRKQLVSQLIVPYKQRNSIDQVKLQKDYSALLATLPWYVKRQFAGTLEISTSYNTPSSADTQNNTNSKKYKN